MPPEIRRGSGRLRPLVAKRPCERPAQIVAVVVLAGGFGHNGVGVDSLIDADVVQAAGCVLEGVVGLNASGRPDCQRWG